MQDKSQPRSTLKATAKRDYEEESDTARLRKATKAFLADHPLAAPLMAPDLWYYARKCLAKDQGDSTAKQLADLVADEGDGLPPVERIIESGA